LKHEKYDPKTHADKSPQAPVREKKKMSRAKKITLTALLSLLGLVVVGFASGLIYVNVLLNRLDRSAEALLPGDPSGDEEDTLGEEPSPEEAAQIEGNAAGGSQLPLKSDPDIENILLIGRDIGESKYFSRSDSMIILSLDKKHKKLKMTSLARDIYISIPGHSNHRLNSAHSYGGPALLIQTIENGFRVKIDRYVSVNFDTYKSIINILGGVDITLTQVEINAIGASLTQDGIDTSGGPGLYHLKSNSALAYARLRKIDTDRMRNQRQRNVLDAIMKDARTLSLPEINSLLWKTLPLVKTDLTNGELIGEMVNLPDYLKWRQEDLQIPAQGTYRAATIKRMWVYSIDVDANARAIGQFIYEE
jgi:LCP family protein required for cell wall assembly